MKREVVEDERREERGEMREERGETGQCMARRTLWVHGARLHGFVASWLRGFVSGGRDVYRLFRCKLWPYAIEFATARCMARKSIRAPSSPSE